MKGTLTTMRNQEYGLYPKIPQPSSSEVDQPTPADTEHYQPDPTGDQSETTADTQPDTAETSQQPETFEQLQARIAKLQGLRNFHDGLERGIIDTGLDVIVQHYGASQLVDHLQKRDCQTFRELIEKMVPDASERSVLCDTIGHPSDDDIARVVDGFNSVGGTVEPLTAGHIKRTRELTFTTINPQQPSGLMHRLHTRTNRYPADGTTDSSQQFFSGGLLDVMADKPQMMKAFCDNNDIFGWLADVRTMYNDNLAELADQLAINHDQLTAEKQKVYAEIATQMEFVDDVYQDEIKVLQDKLDAMEDTDPRRDIAEALLDEKASQIEQQRRQLIAKEQAALTNLAKTHHEHWLAAAQADLGPQLTPKEVTD
ncbi:MAG: hypothetical protein Q4B27_00675 [Candidatus Saccharibacteria bacterium]|nr:hypothetical protein [Candidatus Saccharibacteria bacterium]